MHCTNIAGGIVENAKTQQGFIKHEKACSTCKHIVHHYGKQTSCGGYLHKKQITHLWNRWIQGFQKQSFCMRIVGTQIIHRC
jgi:hypothetical protein